MPGWWFIVLLLMLQQLVVVSGVYMWSGRVPGVLVFLGIPIGVVSSLFVNPTDNPYLSTLSLTSVLVLAVVDSMIRCLFRNRQLFYERAHLLIPAAMIAIPASVVIWILWY